MMEDRKKEEKLHCFLKKKAHIVASTRNIRERKTEYRDFLLSSPHMWSINKINSVLETIYFISAPSVRTCRAEIK